MNRPLFLLGAPPQRLLLSAWTKSSERQINAQKRPRSRYEASQMAVASAMLSGLPCERVNSPFRASNELILSVLGTEKGAKYVVSERS